SGVNLTTRQVYSLLVKESVSRVIYVHNHPSGDPNPSPEDVRFTRKLIEAAKLLDIRVLDHVIVAADGFVSMRETVRAEVDFG
ncbi:MAG: DNA repair protein RadC, partial [Deltaproteobacteria bacterium]|nr:DNA repair protein RadC [Deltaproteobacteria bacterium]